MSEWIKSFNEIFNTFNEDEKRKYENLGLSERYNMLCEQHDRFFSKESTSNKTMNNKNITDWQATIVSMLYRISLEKTGQKLTEEEKKEIENFTTMSSIIEKCTVSEDIQVPNKIDLFDELDITLKDNVFVKSSLEFEQEVLLVNGEDYFVGKLYIEEYNKNGVLERCLVARHDDLNFQNHNSSKYAFVFCEKGRSRYYKVPVEVNCYKTEVTKTHLCIDFGTSNTTAGCFLDSNYVSKISNVATLNGNVELNAENIVRFEYLDPETKEISYNSLLPTIVYVNDCSNQEKIRYDFGYDAAAKIKKDGYCPKASCFMEIKRWTSNISQKEDIQDTNGNKASVDRKQIIAEYLMFVIHSAENQFKCKFKNVHISAPVKLKAKVLDIYADILKEKGYELETKNAIDEGIAVLFSIINAQIKERRYDEGDSRKVLIIDCGGGTSDLASCSYKISKEDGIVDLDITTEYMNGDVNFGGNNITYRIMQYMKIIYANYIKTNNKKITIDEIISMDPNSIFSFIDGNMDSDSEENIKERYDQIYSKLEEMYKEAEKVIPTRYIEYENMNPEEYKKVKNNFYFLWKIAEEMKKEFFRHSNIQRYKFDKKDKSVADDDLRVNKIGEWKLSYRNEADGVLAEQSYPDITLNKSDVSTLLMGDIYYLIRKFLNNMYLTNELQNYKQIQLSGQSTKIDIFTSALKEFLPGRSIKRNVSEKSGDSEQLKLLCVRGAIMYLYALEKSNIEVTLRNATNNIPVSAYTEDSEGVETCMFEQGDNWSQPAVSRRITEQGKEILIKLRNIDRDIGNPYKYDYSNVKYEEKSPDDISKGSGNHISKDVLNSLQPNKKRVFVYLDKAKWGFNILPVYRNENGSIMAGKVTFCSFEMDLLQETFFDGKK